MHKETGIYRDWRDGRAYKTIKIGRQLWMAENLAFRPEFGNYCVYNDHLVNFRQYGYLYDWETAREIAPEGWHLPSNQEWETLHKFLGGSNWQVFNALKEGGPCGFNLLLGGLCNPFGEFYDMGGSADFWSSTLSRDEDGVPDWWSFFSGDDFREGSSLKSVLPAYKLSVRLIGD
ncbi:MAG TPA: FISUMP domain-containing protein [Prolixibacteraceae bacterium]|nr:FISUMP domain-containing protein [Prolixibacteraceae bacterium]